MLVIVRDFQEHLSNLKEVLDLLCTAKLMLKPTKVLFWQQTGLGYIVSTDGISADSRKVTVIQHFPSPRDVKTLQSFLGLASYYQRFVTGFSVAASPLFALTRRNIDFDSGVPQGSVLGPTLFSTFINDLPAVLPSDSIVLFADDTAIYVISNNLTSLNSSLQLCLNLANLWMAKNGLKLNTSKTKCMLLHSSRRKLALDTGLKLHIDGLTVEQVRIFKYLGVVINETLTWSDHINMICSKVTRSLNLLRRLSWFLPHSLLLLYLKSYILPSFDYCDVVWSSCSQEESRRLETFI